MFDTFNSARISGSYHSLKHRAWGSGPDDGLALGSVETWNPLTGAWTERQALHVARVGHTASLLLRGQVLLLGGASGSGAWPMKAAELDD